MLFCSLLMAAAAIFTGCSREITEEKAAVHPENGGKETSLSITIAKDEYIMTRSSERPLLNDLRLLVFDEEHNFLYSRKAVLTSAVIDDHIAAENHLPDGEKDEEIRQMMKYEVAIISSSSRRYIHFVSGYDWTGFPQDYFLQGKSEGEIIPSLTSNSRNIVYWQRVAAESLDESTFKGKVVKMMRNMAHISVVKETNRATSSLKIEGIKIFNTYDRGTVAPYYMNEEGYAFEFPSKSAIPTLPASYAEAVTGDYSSNEADLYERHAVDVRSGNNLYLLLKAKYRGQPCYYKIDLVLPDRNSHIPEMIDIVRNHWYLITIGNVTAKGYDTEEEAIRQPAGNNIFNSIELADYNYISDGSSTLEVTPMGGLYTETGVFTSSVNFTGGAERVRIFSTWEENDPYVGKAYYQQRNSTSGDISINIKKIPEDRIITRTLYVVATNADNTIIKRNITLTLRRPMDFKPSLARDRQKDCFVISLQVPEMLPRSAYPFDIKIYTHDMTPDTKRNRLLIESDGAGYYYKYRVESSEQAAGRLQLYFKNNISGQTPNARLKCPYSGDVNLTL